MKALRPSVFLKGGVAVVLVAAAFGCKSTPSTTGTGGGAATTTGTKMTTTTGTKMTTSTTTTASSMSTATGMGGQAACGIIWDDRAACESCMEGACCSEMSECDPNGTTDCGKIVKCLDACASGDNACQQACIDADKASSMGAGLTAFQAVFSCYDTNCRADQNCEYPICDSMLLFPDKDCADCLGMGTCCDAFKACVGNSACNTCLTGGMAPATCGTAGSMEDTLYKATQDCQDNTCGPKCASSICGSNLGYSGFASCNYCLSQNCCMPFNACTSDMACNACLTNPSGAGCDTNQTFKAYTTCRDTPGANTCGDAGECN